VSTGNKHFDSLVEAGQPVGTIVGVEKFKIKVHGLQPCAVRALVMFEDGSKGFVHQVNPITWWCCISAARISEPI
jgi:F0F1-type ATP synthase alpha subunit